MVTKGLLIRLEVVKGKEQEAEKLLKTIVLPVGTIACFVIRLKDNSYAIFAAFRSKKNRLFYLKSIALKVLEKAIGTIFSVKPTIQKIDIIADKLPQTIPHTPDSKGILMTFRGKENQEYKTEEFLRDAKELVQEEEMTTCWFALSFDNGDYGIFNVFQNAPARISHLTGKFPKRMIKKASSILGSLPEMHAADVLNESLATNAQMEAALIQHEF